MSRELSSDLSDKGYFYGYGSNYFWGYRRLDSDSYWKTEIGFIKKYGMEGRALDVGCAFGYFLRRVCPYFDEVYGIDLSPYALAQARKEVPSAVFDKVNIDAETLPYSDDYFDLVTAFDVLEHTQMMEDNLLKLRSKLKKGGFLIVSVPLRDTWIGRLFRPIDRDEGHVSVPTEREFLALVNRTNMQILEKTYYMPTYTLRGASKIPLKMDIEVILQK